VTLCKIFSWHFLDLKICSETTLTGESCFHISIPWGLNPGPSWLEANRWTTGPVELCTIVIRLQALNRAPSPPPCSQLYRLWSRKEDLQRAWKGADRRAVWDQVGLSHYRNDGPVMVWDKAYLRRGHNDQSRRYHQCSETTPTGESRYYISKYPPGDWTRVPHDVKQTGGPLDQWKLCMNAVRLQETLNSNKFRPGKSVVLMFRYAYKKNFKTSIPLLLSRMYCIAGSHDQRTKRHNLKWILKRDLRPQESTPYYALVHILNFFFEFGFEFTEIIELESCSQRSDT
jgi:hypothetical protein